MKPFNILPSLSLKGSLSLPGDKSIAHRALILGAISSGKIRILNFPFNEDLLSTVHSFKKLGVKIILNRRKKEAVVFGVGLHGLQKPRNGVMIDESGTTFRLLLGLLSGQNFDSVLRAGKSLSKRPMARVIEPLRMMGASLKGVKRISGRRKEEYPPVSIKKSHLKGIYYRLPVASAQVKSALLLATLYAAGKTIINEPVRTRDHTERILEEFQVKVLRKKNLWILAGGQEPVSPGIIYTPGDISSAAFFIIGACILKDSRITIRKVGLNPTRFGLINVLKRMGADITLKPYLSRRTGYEPIGDIVVTGSELKGVKVGRKEIPTLIDELPALMVAASFAKGLSIFEGVEELKVKETDRINSMASNLNRMGADFSIIKQGSSRKIKIYGRGGLKGTALRSFNDHRTAMSLIIAGICASSKSVINDVSCIKKSYPGFIKEIKSLLY